MQLNELINILSTPEQQSMTTLMEACKQSANTLRTFGSLQIRCKEFAESLLQDPLLSQEGIPLNKTESISKTVSQEQQPTKALAPGHNIYLTEYRPTAQKSRKELLISLRELSGDEAAAPRLPLQKINEMLANLEIGKQTIFFRSVSRIEETKEIVDELSALGFSTIVK